MKKKTKKKLLQAVKIGIGCSTAIWIAELLNLEFASAAGSIALLTLVSTKWETVKLSFARLVTSVLSVLLCWILIQYVHIGWEWVAFGIFVFIIVMLCEYLGWKSAISVNALIGMHFLTNKDFTLQAVYNEFMLVLIGILLAIFLNLFYAYRSLEQEIIKDMRYTESQMQLILEELALYLKGYCPKDYVWRNIQELEEKIQGFVEDAYEFQDNTFTSYQEYYISYFEMRLKQTSVLGMLHYEMTKVRTMPKQAEIIAEYIMDMKKHVIEMNIPTEQINNLQEIIRAMEDEPLPVSYEEFKGRAMLYHIMRGLEDFLELKKKFLLNIDSVQYEKYWKKEEQQEVYDIQSLLSE